MRIRQDTKNQDEHVLTLCSTFVFDWERENVNLFSEQKFLQVSEQSEKENGEKRVDKAHTCVGS